MLRAAASLSVVAAVLGCDLYPEPRILEKSFVIDTVDSGRDPCLMQENCLTGPGMRTVLRFDSQLTNIGKTDCTIGWTPTCPTNGLTTAQPDQPPYVYDTCHKHWHFTGLAEYYMYDYWGNLVAAGAKNGLCLMDSDACGDDWKFDCENQGITAGCHDIYERNLDCQWIDITDVDLDGWYEFVWAANTQQTIVETNFTNNEAHVWIDLSSLPRLSPPPGQVVNQCREADDGRVMRYTSPDANSTNSTGSSYIVYMDDVPNLREIWWLDDNSTNGTTNGSTASPTSAPTTLATLASIPAGSS